MAAWQNVSALFSNVSGSFDFGYRYTPPKVIREKDAGVLLKEVDQILQEANGLLDITKSVLVSDDYEAFIAQHRVIQLQMVEDRALYRQLNQELIQHGRIPSETHETMETIQARSVRLLAAAEEYQNKLVRASRNAVQQPIAAFPDELPTSMESEPATEDAKPTPSTSTRLSPAPSPSRSRSPSPAPAPSPSLSPSVLAEPLLLRHLIKIQPARPSFARTNLGLMKRLDEPVPIQPDPKPMVNVPSVFDDPSCLMAITHVLQPHLRASDPNKKVYRRDVSFRHKGRIVTIPGDDQLHELDNEHVAVGPLEMFSIHERILKWSNEALAEDLD